MEPVHRHRVDVRYLEVDQQGVVFNMWYLGWFDDAMTGYLAARGVPYDRLTAAGVDVMLVRTEVDWRAGVGWGDDVVVDVAAAAVGRTSFALDFVVRRDGEPTASARTTYVCVPADGTGTVPVPRLLRDALEPVTPLR